MKRLLQQRFFQLTVPDGYRNLPYKTIAGFLWASGLQEQPRYIGEVIYTPVMPASMLFKLSVFSEYVVINDLYAQASKS
jgi:hypothetical protein